MENSTYLIIGGGMTAAAAANGIRQIDAKGRIAIVSNDSHPPYNRPALSKKLWKGEKEEEIWMKMDNVNLYQGKTIVSIDVNARTAKDNDGTIYRFQKLLIATGGKVNKLPNAPDGIIYYRTFDDYKTLRGLTEKSNDFVLIGGGFIGSEVAASLAMNGKKVTMIFPEDSIGARVYPAGLSEYISNYFREKGVEILNKDGVASIEKNGNDYSVKTSGGKTIKANGVIAGLGVKPNVELAVAIGIKTDNGITVDEYLQTNVANIYAAGDVANFYNPALNKRIRLEHEDTALSMGEIAGKNMAGAEIKYTHLPFFYSDLFELGYEAVGELNSKHQIVEDWKEQFKEGVVYYLDAGSVRGVLLWNTWGQVDNARALIASERTYKPEELKGIIK